MSYWGNLYNWLIMPSEYDTSLSYLQMIGRLKSLLSATIKKLDEVEETVNADKAEIESLKQSFQQLSEYLDNVTAALIDQVNAVISQAETRLDDKITNVENELDASLQYFDQAMAAALAEIKAEMQNALDTLNASNAQFQASISQQFLDTTAALQKAIQDGDDINKAYIDFKIAEINCKLKNLDLPTVYNPFKAEVDTIQNTLNSFYEYMRWEAYTAGEFDIAGLTAEQLDSLGWTALQWDLHGKAALKKLWNWSPFKIRSPNTGGFEDYAKLIHQLFSYHQQGLTAGEFDSLDLTAGQFDGFDIAAYPFDWTPVVREKAQEGA